MKNLLTILIPILLTYGCASNDYYNDYYSSYYVSPSVKTFGSAQILNGLQINISQSFNIHALWSTGFILSQDENHHQETINQGTISIGFKF